MSLSSDSRPTAQELVDDYPVISRSWNANLHFDSYEGGPFGHDDDGGVRFWLHRTGIADGEAFENTISIEVLRDGRWEPEDTYDGGELEE